MKKFSASTTFIGLFIFSLLISPRTLKAESSDDPLPKKKVSLTTAHGLVVGKGNVTYNGAHVQDSLSVQVKQDLIHGTLSETGSASVNTALKSNTLQDGVGDFSLKYKIAGIALGANIGLNYATVLYNPKSKQENQNSGSQLNMAYGVSLSKNTVLNSDSTLEWNIGGSYDAIQDQFKTLSGSTDVEKTWGDFTLDISLSAFNQTQYVNLDPCNSKPGNGASAKQCNDNLVRQPATSTNINGYGLGASLDWTGDLNALSFSTSMDWQISSSVQPTFTGGVTYTFTPYKWLNLNLMASREANLNDTKKTKLWLLGTSVDCSVLLNFALCL